MSYDELQKKAEEEEQAEEEALRVSHDRTEEDGMFANKIIVGIKKLVDEAFSPHVLFFFDLRKINDGIVIVVIPAYFGCVELYVLYVGLCS